MTKVLAEIGIRVMRPVDWTVDRWRRGKGRLIAWWDWWGGLRRYIDRQRKRRAWARIVRAEVKRLERLPGGFWANATQQREGRQ